MLFLCFCVSLKQMTYFCTIGENVVKNGASKRQNGDMIGILCQQRAMIDGVIVAKNRDA